MTFEELEQLPVLKQFCDMFRSMTDLPFHLLDRKLNVSRRFPELSSRYEFCRLIQKTPQGRQECFSSASKAGIDSARSVKPYIYLCHAGLMDIAVPIISKENCIGFLCSGKILVHKPTVRQRARLAQEWKEIGCGDQARIQRAFSKTRVMPLAKVKRIAQFLQFIINYIMEMEDKTAYLSQNLAKYDPVVKAQFLIRAQYADKLTLETVARHVGLSPSRFEHVFKERAGSTFVHYLQRVRLDKARLLLGDSSLRISEIALESGFASLAHFNRTFKAVEGIAPRIYRRQARSAESIK